MSFLINLTILETHKYLDANITQMSTTKSTYQSDIVLGFKEIPKKDYSRQIYFIEQNQDEVERMDTFFRIDLMEKYSIALFEIGHYGKCLKVLDPLIFDVVDIDFRRKEEDVFYNLLIRKTSCLYNTKDFDGAEHVAYEMIKIKPDSKQACSILRSTKAKIIKRNTAGLRALVVMFLLFGLGITCFDLLIAQSFLEDYTPPIKAVRNTFMILSMGSLVAIELAAILVSKYKTRQFQDFCLAKKSNQ